VKDAIDLASARLDIDFGVRIAPSSLWETQRRIRRLSYRRNDVLIHDAYTNPRYAKAPRNGNGYAAKIIFVVAA
jgi:hypothetical protein